MIDTLEKVFASKWFLLLLTWVTVFAWALGVDPNQVALAFLFIILAFGVPTKSD